jgi:hypothetical protein
MKAKPDGHSGLAIQINSVAAKAGKDAYPMSCNFKISAHRNCDNLHLKLEGDFDGTSACELINYLKKNIRRSSRVFIHTNCLKDIYPFGRDVFRNNFDFKKSSSVAFVFTGEKADQLAPEQSRNAL